MDFGWEQRVYIYKNQTNNNGRVIVIHKATKKQIVYSIYNYCDDNIDFNPRDLLVSHKKTNLNNNRIYIELYLSFYYPDGNSHKIS